MSTEPVKQRRRAPVGVILIALLLIVVAFFSAGVGTLVRSEALAEAGLPRLLLLSFAAVTAVLPYGLLRLRRWAWAATLSFVVVQLWFLLLQALAGGTTQLVGLALLATMGAYLLRPQVRRVFLGAQST